MAVMQADPRPMIRATAAYAIGEIVRKYDAEMIEILRAQYQREADADQAIEFRHEFERAINRINELKH